MSTEHNQAIGITIDARRALKKLADIRQIIDAETILNLIGLRQLTWIGDNLDAAGSDDPWATMKPRTIRERPVRQSDRHFSSRYQALLRQSMAHDVELVREAVKVGTEARYARYHHHGARKEGTAWVLPSRKLIPSKTRARMLAMDVIRAIHAKVRARGTV